MRCKSCGLDHAELGMSTGQPCARVKRLAAARGVVAHAPAPAVNIAPAANEAVNIATATAVNKPRGRYPNTDARRLYMRDLMRRKRAAG